MSTEEIKAEEYPLPRVTTEGVSHLAYKGWDIVFVSDGGIAKSLEAAKVQHYLNGVQNVPDMLFARNRLYLIHKQSDVLLSFSLLEAIQLCLLSL